MKKTIRYQTDTFPLPWTVRYVPIDEDVVVERAKEALAFTKERSAELLKRGDETTRKNAQNDLDWIEEDPERALATYIDMQTKERWVVKDANGVEVWDGERFTDLLAVMAADLYCPDKKSTVWWAVHRLIGRCLTAVSLARYNIFAFDNELIKNPIQSAADQLKSALTQK